MAVRKWRFNWLGSQRSTSQPFSLGLATTVVQADGTSVANTYWLTGELRKVTGSRVYPVEYTSDTVGRMATMMTWRNFAGNSGAAVTTWLYDDRGRLQYKRYDDAFEVSYQYTPGSRLKYRTWARSLWPRA